MGVEAVRGGLRLWEGGRSAIALLRLIYKATPLPALRRVYYAAFSRLVRNKVSRARIDGVVYELDLGEMIDLSIYLRSYEPDVTRALHRFCLPGMTVLDVGANVGAHTLVLGKIVGPTGRVIAFEPTDYAFRKLLRNLSLNDMPWISPVKVALGDRNSAHQRVDFRSSWRTDHSRADTVSIVDYMRLDDWCAQNLVGGIGLVKMDVDGNEYPILAGGRSVLGDCRPVILLEAVGPHFEDEASNPFRFLEKLGYSLHDGQSGYEFKNLQEMRRLLPSNDWAMTKSINVIAAADRP